MELVVNKDNLQKINEIKPNSGSIQYYIVDVEFDESWNDLNKKAILVSRDKRRSNEGISIPVINNQIYIDNKLSGIYGIGFVGYTIENEEKTYQISTNFVNINFIKGAGEVPSVNEADVPTPSQWEEYIAQIEDIVSQVTHSQTYIHRQDLASSEWIINHKLNKFPSITVVDSSGNIVYGDVTYIDNNNIQVSFSAEFSGRAYLN